MLWLYVVLAWFGFAKVLEQLPLDGEGESPEFMLTFRDGRSFSMAFHARRVV